MIDLEFVESLIKALDESSLDTLEVERGGTRVRLSKSPPVHSPAAPEGAHKAASAVAAGGLPIETEVAPMATASPGQDEGHDGLLKVTCPMVGTFYSAPSPDTPPYVAVGQSVGEGTVLCIIEAMKLMNELESEVEGTITQVLVENAQPVEYGQVLFLIDPS